jgi:hypothetical protein
VNSWSHEDLDGAKREQLVKRREMYDYLKTKLNTYLGEARARNDGKEPFLATNRHLSTDYPSHSV